MVSPKLRIPIQPKQKHQNPLPAKLVPTTRLHVIFRNSTGYLHVGCERRAFVTGEISSCQPSLISLHVGNLAQKLLIFCYACSHSCLALSYFLRCEKSIILFITDKLDNHWFCSQHPQYLMSEEVEEGWDGTSLLTDSVSDRKANQHWVIRCKTRSALS